MNAAGKEAALRELENARERVDRTNFSDPDDRRAAIGALRRAEENALRQVPELPVWTRPAPKGWEPSWPKN